MSVRSNPARAPARCWRAIGAPSSAKAVSKNAAYSGSALSLSSAASTPNPSSSGLERPDLQLVALADGAKDNWTFLEDNVAKRVPKSVCILDFFHAAEHLSDAFAAAYGESVKARATFDKYRRILLEDFDGIEKVIRTVARLQKGHPRNKRLKQVLGYLRENRHRMRYAEYRELGLPIGSGVVEAACKTLVSQRMKNSGMRWSNEGGQAIVTMRSWCQSDRFDRAWALLAATYQADVHVLAPVIELRGRFEKV